MGIDEIVKSIFNSQQEQKSAAHFALNGSFLPFRLTSRKNDTVDLILELTNISGGDVLASVAVAVPKGIGVDSTMIAREKNLRVGQMKADESKKARIPMFSAASTKPGVYPISIEVFSHYRDFGHVITSIKKEFEVRVV
ncbi:hypothetical protein FJZ26_01515 [Candidatus Parvarchaeota archaeon]|nr:hypothetical protein [Candidatus Parvarchaeota archaeon]